MAPQQIWKTFSGFAPDLQIDLKRPCTGSNYKITDKWQDGVFEVVSQREDGPVFSVKQISTNTEQVVHRNMIHPARSVMKDEVSKDRVSALAKANALMDVMFSD